LVKVLTGVLSAVALVALAGGCADVEVATATAPDDRWSDIDTSRPSEDPVATVFGYVQAMATGDETRACAFQYRGSSDHRDEPCVLAEEMPRTDRQRSTDDWATLAGYRLEDYAANGGDRGWRVSLPTAPMVRWRIRQDDAGIWFIE
jgi:hypothetical protein